MKPRDEPAPPPPDIRNAEVEPDPSRSTDEEPAEPVGDDGGSMDGFK